MFTFVFAVFALFSLVAHARAQGAYTPRSYQHQLCPADPEQSDVHLSALTGYAVGPKFAGSDPSAHMLRPFFSDGCSSSPDKLPLTGKSSNYVQCCIEHDTAYWLGGTREEKDAADSQLEKCIASKDMARTAKVYKFFVQKLGGPDSYQSYRWGYGWNYRRPFGPITKSEERQVVALYGVGPDKIRETLLASDFRLLKLCDLRDPVFYGWNEDEMSAYRLLNATLKKDDLVEWAQWDYFNLEKRQFQVKLRSCPAPMTITFHKGAAPTLQSECLP